MTGKERIAATMQGLPVDQCPFVPLLSLYGAKLTDCPLDTYYTDPAAYARGQSAVVETFHPDVLAAPFALAKLGEAFGGTLRFFEDQPPNLARPAIRSINELESMCMPDIDSHPSLTYFREALRQISSAHGEDTIVAVPTLGPFDLPIMIFGLDGWLETVLARPDEVSRVIEVTGQFFLRWIDAMLADGAGAVVLPAPFLIPTVITRELAKNTVLPALQGIYAQLPCPVLPHAVGSPLLPLLDLLCELPNVGGAVLDEGEDLVAAREVIGPESILFGGLDGGLIWRRSPEELRTAAREILQQRRSDPRFVFTTVGPDVAWQTSPEQIRTIQQTIAETGGS